MGGAEAQDAGGVVWDAPNQQAVRADQSAPWDEGTGGQPGAAGVETAAGDDAGGTDLDAMTKAQLHAYADAHGVEVNDEMTKADMRAAIDAAAV